jgi:phage major head subunit gpT-like protein
MSLKKNKRIIRAGKDVNTPHMIVSTFGVDITAAAGEGKLPTFAISAYNGGAMRPQGFSYPVVIDLSGMSKSNATIPILLDHNPSQIVGQADNIEIGASTVTLSGSITGDPDSPEVKKVVTNAKNGFKWQASVGASIDEKEWIEQGKSAKVNGRMISGPVLIARKSTLVETSFVAIGADLSTSAKVAATKNTSLLETDMKFTEWLKANGFEADGLSEKQTAVLKAAYEAEIADEDDDSEPAPAPKKGKGKGKLEAGGNSANASDIDEMIRKERAERARVSDIQRVTRETITACPDRLDDIEAAARTAVEKGVSAQSFELEMLRLSRTAPQIIIPGSATPMNDSVVEAGICMTAGLSDPEKHFNEKTLEAAQKHFAHGVGLKDILAKYASSNGYSGSANATRDLLRFAFAPAAPGIRAAPGNSTHDLGGVLSNVANKFMREGFMNVEQAWRKIAAVRNVRDFKQITTYSLTGDFTFKEVAPGGEIKHGTAGAEVYNNQARTYGIMFGVDRRDIVNDDLGALTMIPRRIGRGGALNLNEQFWAKFMNNSAFFTDPRGNYVEGATSNLQITSLTTAEQKFLDQTDPNGKPMGAMPKLLLVPTALSAVAAQLMNSTELRDNTANRTYGVSNPHAGKFETVVSAYLSNTSFTGNSTKAWYLLADPNDVPVIEVAFLNGADSPRVESADADFNVLGIQMRGYWDHGVELQEYRGGVKTKGEN